MRQSLFRSGAGFSLHPLRLYHQSMDYTEINSRTIDGWADSGWEWAIPVSHEEYEEALSGKARIYVTPTKAIPSSWLGTLRGKRVLALASGGGQQGPLLHALGAEVTVFDNSRKMLEKDEEVALREGYSIETILGDMTEPLPFPDGSFSIIVNPVSNCYIEHPEDVWKKCWRVLEDGGRLIAGLDNGMNFIVSEDEERIIYPLPYNPLRNPEQMEELDEKTDGIQFSHTYEENIQGMIDCGFTIRGIYNKPVR